MVLLLLKSHCLRLKQSHKLSLLYIFQLPCYIPMMREHVMKSPMFSPYCCLMNRPGSLWGKTPDLQTYVSVLQRIYWKEDGIRKSDLHNTFLIDLRVLLETSYCREDRIRKEFKISQTAHNCSNCYNIS